MPVINPLTLAAARQIIFAAETKAYQLASPGAISVIDLSGQLIAHVRMEGARTDRANPSLNKALNILTIALCQRFDSAPEDLAATRLNFRGDMAEFTVELETDLAAPLKTESGAVLLHNAGEILGAIGVSSAQPDNDQAIALAASDAFTNGAIVTSRSSHISTGSPTTSVRSLFP